MGNGYLGMMIDELEIAFNVNGRRDKLREQAMKNMISQ